jgi:hypothetical protein
MPLYWIIPIAIIGYALFRKHPEAPPVPPVPHGDPFFTNLEKTNKRHKG